MEARARVQGACAPQTPPTPPTAPTRPRSPTLQSQFFSQSYESILPNSFTHILLCTRGYSPWKPEAVLSTPARRKNLQVGWALRFSRGIMRGPNALRKKQALCRTLDPFSPQRNFWDASQDSLKRKEDSSRFSCCRVAVSLRCRAISRQVKRRYGILTVFPFAWTWKTSKLAIQLSRAFASSLGATHPCPIAVHTEPFSTSVYKDHTCIVATSTKICTRHRSTRFHNLTLLHLMSTPPYFLSNIRFCPKTSYKSSALASSFFRAGEFGRLVVTHYLAGADFHGHGPTV